MINISQESFPRSRIIIIYCVLCSSIKLTCFDYHDYPSYSSLWSQRSLGDQLQISPSPVLLHMASLSLCCKWNHLNCKSIWKSNADDLLVLALLGRKNWFNTFRTIRNDLKRSGEEFLADSKPFVHLQRLQSLRRKWKHLENLVYFCSCFFFFYFFFSFFLLQHDRFSWSCCSASRFSNSK